MDEFDPIFYLYANPDVAEAGIDPFEHYTNYGRDENRSYILPTRLSPMASELHGRREFFSKAFSMLSYNQISGDYVEFGSGGAATLTMAYLESASFGEERHFWTFDSFKGLPKIELPEDVHPRWYEGAYAVGEDEFKRRCKFAGISDDKLHIIPGYYEKSLTENSSKFPKDISIAYIDCDLFSSTVLVLEFIRNRIKNGMILAFDDYFCYTSSSKSAEHLALSRFSESLPGFELERYLPIGWHGQSFIVYCR